MEPSIEADTFHKFLLPVPQDLQEFCNDEKSGDIHKEFKKVSPAVFYLPPLSNCLALNDIFSGDRRVHCAVRGGQGSAARHLQEPHQSQESSDAAGHALQEHLTEASPPQKVQSLTSKSHIHLSNIVTIKSDN